MSALALPIRIIQGILAIIILGLMAYVVDSWPYSGYFWSWSQDTPNFLLFVSVWTLLALIYLVLASYRFADHPAGHKFGVLAVETLTTIFWFAGFIAFASLLGDIRPVRGWSIRDAGIAADVFAAFEWLLFSATLIFSALHCWRTKGERSSKPDPSMQVDNRV